MTIFLSDIKLSTSKSLYLKRCKILYVSALKMYEKSDFENQFYFDSN